jgi:hypothetical protein
VHQQILTWKTGPFCLFYLIDKQEFSFWGQKGGMTINKLFFKNIFQETLQQRMAKSGTNKRYKAFI